MFKTERPIFRENALKHYIRNGEKTVLPHFISPPVIFLLWCLLGLVASSIAVAWFWRVPVYLNAIGEIGMTINGAEQTPVIVVPLEKSQLSQLHPGMSAQLTVGAGGLQWQQSIATIDRTPTSPIELRLRYKLDASVNLLVRQPAAVMLFPLRVALPFHLYQGSVVQVKIQVGSQRLISLLPLLGGLGGV
jgi:hypothetical protein